MKLLLDTHVLLWGLSDDARLSSQAKHAITSPDNEVLVSVVSLWEIVIKMRVGKLRGKIAQIRDAVAQTGFTRLAIEEGHLDTLAPLPFHHRDPFDHLLVAQAMREKATLVSDDHAMTMYPVSLMSAATIKR